MLTPAQNSSVAATYPGIEVYCSAACRLYSSTTSSWDYTGVCGAASLLIQSDIYYMKILHLDVSNE